jgi:hypothetical protein
MSEVRVGRRDADHIAIRCLWRTHPEANDYWDGNWVDSEVIVNIEPWRATYRANLRTDEFSRFRDQLREMYEGRREEASFDPMEPWLMLTLAIDGLGRIAIEGDTGPEGGGKVFGQVRLHFRLEDGMDQSDLPQLITQLDELERNFPTRGRPTR